MEAYRNASESQVALFYAVEQQDAETLRATDWTVMGTGRRAREVLGSFEQGFTVSSATALGPPEWESRFVRLDEVTRRMPTAMARLHRETTSAVGVVDQLMLPITTAGRYLGLLVGLRFDGDRPFEAKRANAIRELVAPLSGHLVTAQRMVRSARPEEACDLFVDGRGEVDFASAHGASWLALDDVREELRRVVSRVDRGEIDGRAASIRGASTRVVRMERDGKVRYLVHLARPAELPEKLALTESEYEVAVLAASGATATEIAAMRGTAAGTVKNQLKQVYARLQVATRAELARALRL